MADAVKFLCPQCRSAGRISTYVTALVHVEADGSYDTPDPGDNELGALDDSEVAICLSCAHHDALGYFRVREGPRPSRTRQFQTEAEAAAFIAGIELFDDSAISVGGPRRDGPGYAVDVFDEDDPGDEDA